MGFRIVLAVGAITVWALAARAAEPDFEALTVYRAFPVFGSEGSREVARRELGCDGACVAIEDPRPDVDREYLINRAAGVAVGKRHVVRLYVGESDKKAVVLAVLNELGKDALASINSARIDAAANFLGGQLLAIVPLHVVESAYAVAVCDSRSEAEKIAEKLPFSRE